MKLVSFSRAIAWEEASFSSSLITPSFISEERSGLRSSKLLVRGVDLLTLPGAQVLALAQPA